MTVVIDFKFVPIRERILVCWFVLLGRIVNIHSKHQSPNARARERK